MILDRIIQRPMTVTDSVVVDATPVDVWELVADPTRIASFSPENTGADSPHDGPLSVGQRFVGHNRRGKMTWSTSCEVTESEPGRSFAFKVTGWGTSRFRVPVPIATWRFEMTEHPEGTVVTETWTDDRRWPDLLTGPFDRAATGGQSFADFQTRNIRRSLDQLAAVLAG